MILMRKEGLEPSWVTPLDPKSSASASSATFAVRLDSADVIDDCQLRWPASDLQGRYLSMRDNDMMTSGVPGPLSGP